MRLHARAPSSRASNGRVPGAGASRRNPTISWMAWREAAAEKMTASGISFARCVLAPKNCVDKMRRNLSDHNGRTCMWRIPRVRRIESSIRCTRAKPRRTNRAEVGIWWGSCFSLGLLHYELDIVARARPNKSRAPPNVPGGYVWIVLGPYKFVGSFLPGSECGWNTHSCSIFVSRAPA